MPQGRTLGLTRCWAQARVFALPALLLLVVTLPHLGQGDFRGDAGWYSAIGLQAWRTGSFWSLRAEPGIFYFNKPPLAFWIHGLALHVLGPSVWAARIPTIAAAMGVLLVSIAIMRDLAGRRAAVFSGIALALTMEFFRRTREISLDMWQTLWLMMALWMVVRAVLTSDAGGRRNLLVLSGIPIGLALLTKPLVGLLFFPVVAAWLIWTGRARLLGWLSAAVLVCILVAAPWHISMAAVHGREFIAHYFGAEIAQRATGRLLAGHDSTPPIWFYAVSLAETYWPWTIPLVLLLIDVARGRIERRERSATRLALFWAGLWLLFLTLYPDRRDRYALVLYPATAWLAGLWLARIHGPRWRSIQRTVLRAGTPVGAGLGIVLAVLPIRFQAPPDPHWQALFAWIDAQPAAGRTGIWQGAVSGAQSARLYLTYGAWPISTRDRHGRQVAEPPEGALLLYHHRAGWAPGPTEERVFATPEGRLVITRLGEGGWHPIRADDPGE